MVMWELQANLLLNFNKYIPLLLFCIIFYIFLTFTFVQLNFNKLFKNKCGRYDQGINIKPVYDQNTVFAKRKASEGTK